MSLSEVSNSSNEITLGSIQALCSPSEANLIPQFPEGDRRPVDVLTPFLQHRRNLDTRLLQQLAEANNLIRPYGETAETVAIGTTFSLFDSLMNFIYMLEWISFFCSFSCRRHQGKEGTIMVGVLVGVIGLVVSALLGTTIGLVISSAIKVQKACSRISRQRQSTKNIQEALKSSTERPLARAAAVTALQASAFTEGAYKRFRASSISFLVVGIIATLALLALIAGAIMAIFFGGPAAPVVFSTAMMGCCAAGALTFGITLAFLVIATFYSRKKRVQTAHIIQRALLHVAISEQLIQYPETYYRDPLSKSILERCLNSCCQLFSTEDRAALGLSQDLYNRRLPWGGVPIQVIQPPSYEEVIGPNSRIYDTSSRLSPSAPPPPSPPPYTP